MKLNAIVKLYILPVASVLFIVVTVFTGGYLARPFLEGTPLVKYPLLEKSISILEKNGLKTMPGTRPLEYGLIRGALLAYDDPFTVFVEPVQAELQSDQLEGKFGGVGARLERDPEGYIVLLPFPDSPAAKAGIREGERLLNVNDQSFDANAPIDQAQAALRGPVGTRVIVTVAPPPDYPPRQVEVRRQEVAAPSTTWNIYPGDASLGVIQVNIIAATTSDEIQKAVTDLQARGATRFALDLRNNGGGLLEAGVDIARLFLAEGIVITQQYRDRNPDVFRVQKTGPLVGIPLAVLVNQNTASAAEIIAGALQGHNRAALVGTRTYGKDTIQLVFDLEDGSSLHITAARWWFPGKESGIGGTGLEPDWPVQEDPNNPAAIFNAAIQALNGD